MARTGWHATRLVVVVLFYAIERTGNIVPCVGVSVAKRGVGRVGIGGMVERTKTGGGGFGIGTGLLPDHIDKVVAAKHTDDGGYSIKVIDERGGDCAIAMAAA